MLDSCCSIIILFLFSKIILFLEKTFYSWREGGNMLSFLVHSWFILGKKDTLGHNLTLTTFNRQQTKLLILTNPRLYNVDMSKTKNKLSRLSVVPLSSPATSRADRSRLLLPYARDRPAGVFALFSYAIVRTSISS